MIRRESKSIKKKVKLFVEGLTEENYFNGLKEEPDVCLSIKPVNMHGGGYSNFINILKKSDVLGNLAIFIVIDLDRASDDPKELNNLNNLVKYCNQQNKKKSSIPHILIGTNPDFEYFACSHCLNYKNSDTKSYIIDNFNYKDIQDYKADVDVYKKLNKEKKSYENALKHVKKYDVYFNYDYEIKKAELDIIIKLEKTSVELKEHALSNKHSNVYDLFNVVFFDAH